MYLQILCEHHDYLDGGGQSDITFVDSDDAEQLEVTCETR